MKFWIIAWKFSNHRFTIILTKFYKFAEDVKQNNSKASILNDATKILRDLIVQVESLRKENANLITETQYVSSRSHKIISAFSNSFPIFASHQKCMLDRNIELLQETKHLVSYYFINCIWCLIFSFLILLSCCLFIVMNMVLKAASL